MEPEQSGSDADSQDVNPVFLQQLRELDIPEEAAKQVGQYTQSGQLVSVFRLHLHQSPIIFMTGNVLPSIFLKAVV